MITAKEAGAMQELVEAFPLKRKPIRVKAFKEDYIERALRAEMRVHQLECELRKMQNVSVSDIFAEMGTQLKRFAMLKLRALL